MLTTAKRGSQKPQKCAEVFKKEFKPQQEQRGKAHRNRRSSPKFLNKNFNHSDSSDNHSDNSKE